MTFGLDDSDGSGDGRNRFLFLRIKAIGKVELRCLIVLGVWIQVYDHVSCTLSDRSGGCFYPNNLA